MTETTRSQLLKVKEEEMKFVPKQLSHLSLEQVQELITRYYNGERVNVLIEEYKIHCRASDLYKLFPPVVTGTCEYCSSPIVCNRLSKSNYRNEMLDAPVCVGCGHRPLQWCDCFACKKKREEEAKKREAEARRLIQEHYDLSELEPVPLEKMNGLDRILLASLIRMGMDVNLEMTEPGANWVGKMSPTPFLDRKILNHLVTRKIIFPHPKSPTNAFTGDEKNPFPELYYIFRVNYHINVDLFLKDRKKAIEVLANPTFNDVFQNASDVALLDELWMDLAIAEAEEYLELQLKDVKVLSQHQLLPISDDTRLIFKSILKDFSSGQLFNLIYRSVKDGLRFKESKGIRDPETVIKFVVGRCRRIAERSLAEGWMIKPFHRDYRNEQSMVSQLLYDRVLQIGEKGFELIPCWNSYSKEMEFILDNSRDRESPQLPAKINGEEDNEIPDKD